MVIDLHAERERRKLEQHRPSLAHELIEAMTAYAVVVAALVFVGFIILMQG